MQGTSGTMAMNPTIFKHLSYEPLKTLVPVSLVAGVPFVLTVNPTLPVHSVADLVALAKKRSAEGKPLTYGSGRVCAGRLSIEACASAHHWSRQLQALGHTVRLMPPPYVRDRCEFMFRRCERQQRQCPRQ